jgi:hypothetical protein
MTSPHILPTLATPTCCPCASQLLKAGRTVVAAVRSADKAADVYGGLGLKEGYQGPGRSGGILFTAPGVDVSDAGTLTADLFKGVTQVRGPCTLLCPT